MKEPFWPGLGCGQAGDKVGDLGADLVADAALALDARDLGGARPREVRDDFGADRDPARLDAAVALLDGLSSGQIRRRSGGVAACLRGGKIAEALGDVGFQRGLVVFHHEHIVALSVGDRLTDFPLAEDRVAGDDRARERQLLEQRERRRDLVFLGRNREIANHRGQLRGESRDHVQRLGVEPAAAPQRLAVKGDMARFVAPAGEAAERPRQGVAVKRAEDIMIGGVAGRPLNAEQRQRLGLEAAAPAENATTSAKA